MNEQNTYRDNFKKCWIENNISIVRLEEPEKVESMHDGIIEINSKLECKFNGLYCSSKNCILVNN